MGYYHFYILDKDGRTAGHREHACRDDDAALEIAWTLCDHRPVEVWTDKRRVAHLKQSDAALRVRA